MERIFCFLFIAISAAIVSAQQNENPETLVKTCGNFKMPIIVPSGDFDSSMIIEPVFGDKSKIISINPCGETENEQTKTAQDKPVSILFPRKKR